MKLHVKPQEKQPGLQQATEYSHWLQEVLDELTASNDKVDIQIAQVIESELSLKSLDDDTHSKL